VTLDFSRPGKPTDKAFIESINARARQECLNQHWFLSLVDARLKINRWRHEYNNDRPHSMPGYLAPAEYAEKHSNALEEERNLGQIFAHVVA
jgi:putative transposase